MAEDIFRRGFDRSWLSTVESRLQFRGRTALAAERSLSATSRRGMRTDRLQFPPGSRHSAVDIARPLSRRSFPSFSSANDFDASAHARVAWSVSVLFPCIRSSRTAAILSGVSTPEVRVVNTSRASPIATASLLRVDSMQSADCRPGLAGRYADPLPEALAELGSASA